MQLHLTTYERLMCARVLNNVEGNVGTLRAALKLVAMVDFSDEESRRISLVTNPMTGMATWTDDTVTWDIELSANDLAFLRSRIEDFHWTGTPPKLVVALADKLAISA